MNIVEHPTLTLEDVDIGEEQHCSKDGWIETMVVGERECHDEKDEAE